jgi:hypothetical protein
MRTLWKWLAAPAAFAALAGGAWAQTAGAVVNPQELVKSASYNELQASNQGHPFRYKLHKVDNGKITTKLIIETRDGDVARLIATGDKPLLPEADQAEIQRLNRLLADPSIQEHRRKREQADSTRANEMVRLLPDAFLYKYIGMAQTPSGPSYRLSFVPNPNFTPPDREAEVYHGMAGELWIDQRQRRMSKLDAHLIADVDFGWGIVGKLFKGGSILVEQKDVGDGHWESNLLKLNLEGKILLVKSLTIDTTEEETGFAPVPAAWGYQDAVRALLAEK